jgi:hypothetical protein
VSALAVPGSFPFPDSQSVSVVSRHLVDYPWSATRNELVDSAAGCVVLTEYTYVYSS